MLTTRLLLLNAGSSSLKTTLIEVESKRVLASSLADWAGKITKYHYVGPDGEEQIRETDWRGQAKAVFEFIKDISTFENLSNLRAVGHRIVHGGSFSESVLISPSIRQKIEALSALAPLHNPPALEALTAAESELPELPHIAVFDTAFHSTLAPVSWMYPIPRSWYEQWAIRRYGFHGLSFAYCSERSAALLCRPLEELRLVICHLGHGCSAAAVQGGKSVDTTMGFTPLEGLVMGTRSGSIDPGILLHLQMECGLNVEEIFQALNRQSGLLALSGISGDMREVLAASKDGNLDAKLAIEIYVRKVQQAISSLTATMGGIDGLIFTAGVGEHAAEIRSLICSGLEFLGLSIEKTINADCKADAEISSFDSRVRVLVVKTREDLTMLSELVAVLNRSTRDSN